MKVRLIILSATVSLAFGAEEKAVDVGSFDYRGRSFVNAKAFQVAECMGFKGDFREWHELLRIGD